MGKGRPKGVGNHNTRVVQEALLRSFEEVGSYKYLVVLAEKEPVAYATLIGKLIPRIVDQTIHGPDDGPVQVELNKQAVAIGLKNLFGLDMADIGEA
jgi:hypothetical protein